MPVNKKSLQLLLLVLLGFLAYRFFSTPATEPISGSPLPWTGFIVVGILLALAVMLAFKGAKTRQEHSSEVDQEHKSD